MMDFDARTKKYSNIINNTLNDAFYNDKYTQITARRNEIQY